MLGADGNSWLLYACDSAGIWARNPVQAAACDVLHRCLSPNEQTRAGARARHGSILRVLVRRRRDTGARFDPWNNTYDKRLLSFLKTYRLRGSFKIYEWPLCVKPRRICGMMSEVICLNLVLDLISHLKQLVVYRREEDECTYHRLWKYKEGYLTNWHWELVNIYATIYYYLSSVTHVGV